MAADLLGQTLGDYKLTEKIGEGGMATVYKGFQTSLNRFVALKVLYYREDTSLERFQREAKAIAALRHRNILIIYEYGEQDGQPFIAMEYVANGTLEDRLSGRPMDWKRVIELAIPIAEALYYAHTNGIIHRDIKPSNILMPQEDWPVLADFGLVKRSDEEQGLTMTGTFMGTPSYIAPEQARDVDVDYRADMYALGVIMFEMITGELPFDYENPNKILLAHVTEEPTPPSRLNPHCPPLLEQVILKSLQKSPSDRFADMHEVVEALKLALNESASEGWLADNDGQPQVAEEEATSIGKLFSPFRRMFGGKREDKSKKKDTASRTTPQDQLTDLATDYDDEDDDTIRLNMKNQPSTAARIVLQNGKVTLELPRKNSIVIGRTYRDTVVDLDLEPHEASKYGVSRRHSRLVKQGDNWLLEDLGSLNGTFVNDTQVKQGRPVALQEGDHVRLSHLTFIFFP